MKLIVWKNGKFLQAGAALADLIPEYLFVFVQGPGISPRICKDCRNQINYSTIYKCYGPYSYCKC